MAEFNWVTALLGGILIGISATLLLACNGRIAGIRERSHSPQHPPSCAHPGFSLMPYSRLE
jgi:hypothetical protein